MVTRPVERPLLDRERMALWAAVEGAVVDALKSHPDYFTDRGRKLAVGSITKRVVGQLSGAIKRSARTEGSEGFQPTPPLQVTPGLFTGGDEGSA